MSEIVKYNEEPIKIGTKMNLYCGTYHQLKASLSGLQHVSGNLEPKEYLNPLYRFLYRFPFADEQPDLDCKEFDKRFFVTIPRALLTSDITLMHGQMPLFNRKVKRFEFSLNVTCPASPECEYHHHAVQQIADYLLFELGQQTIVNNRLATVGYCPFCEKASVFTFDEINEMNAVVQNNTSYFDTLTRENMQNAFDGYSEDCTF